jgi:hypothetical protein
VPIAVIGTWFMRRREPQIPKKAFLSTLALLVPVGFGLDFFFANRFFVFPNRGATLGIGAPALGGPVPVEEYVFYLTGFMAVLLIYVWLDEYWLAAYNVPDYHGPASRHSAPRALPSCFRPGRCRARGSGDRIQEAAVGQTPRASRATSPSSSGSRSFPRRASSRARAASSTGRPSA